MIEKILELSQKTDFDFRKYSSSSDELSYLFDEWVPYYQMKFAICKTLNPKSILEIGVRYGYSAITFLSAAPNAQYLGIDNDTDSFGGSIGAIEWAKKITKNYNAYFLIANTQEMEILPGTSYDLVHIDGQQDGDGTFRDLELALPKAKWILVDGYFWSKENMLSSTYFLEKYKKFIEYAFIIPSIQGDLLIKIKDSAKNINIFGKNYSDQAIREEYNQTYFLQDCGGYEPYKKYQGKELQDERLRAAMYLSTPIQGKKILDIGCGRGELCYALAKAGANVTGIDYSSTAIAIAKKTFPNTVELDFICQDFLDYQCFKKFDRIIATDFVEHIEKKRYDLVLKKVAELLKPGGLFIIHTSPNAFNYEDPYSEKRAIARSIGSYLPKNPRTHYDDVMHINEQTPDSLKTSLGKYFANVIVWVATAPDNSGSLGREFSLDEMKTARSIFSIASHSPLNKTYLLSQLLQNPLDPNTLSAKITVRSFPEKVTPTEHFIVDMELENLCNANLGSMPPNPVYLTYHWLDKTGNSIIWDGIRTRINYPLLPGEKRNFSLNILAPNITGEFTLQLTLVQEGCFWFENLLPSLPVSLMIGVNPEVQNPLDAVNLDAKISVRAYPLIVDPDEYFSVEIMLENLSAVKWGSLLPNPVNLTYHWFDKKGKCIVWEGFRTDIESSLLPGEKRDFSLIVVAPNIKGEHTLQITLVQEGCFWFENLLPSLPISLMIGVNPEVQNPLDAVNLDAKISVRACPLIVDLDEFFSVDGTLENLSTENWGSFSPNPVSLSYHWFDKKGKCIVWEGFRTDIESPLLPGEKRDFSVNVNAPKVTGKYTLQITLVQEGCFWFEEIIKTLPVSLIIKVKKSNEK